MAKLQYYTILEAIIQVWASVQRLDRHSSLHQEMKHRLVWAVVTTYVVTKAPIFCTWSSHSFNGNVSNTFSLLEIDHSILEELWISSQVLIQMQYEAISDTHVVKHWVSVGNHLISNKDPHPSWVFDHLFKKAITCCERAFAIERLIGWIMSL